MDRLNAQKAQLEKAFAQEKDEAQKQNLKTGIASLESQISALTAQRIPVLISGKISVIRCWI